MVIGPEPSHSLDEHNGVYRFLRLAIAVLDSEETVPIGASFVTRLTQKLRRGARYWRKYRSTDCCL